MLALFSAIWLGILTSISPCPLATNIAAITFLSKKIVHPRAVLFAGIAYTIGRMITYALIGTLIVTSLVKIPVAAMFLQKYMSKILGPILLITGLVLSNIIKINLSGFTISHHKTTFHSGVRLIWVRTIRDNICPFILSYLSRFIFWQFDSTCSKQ